MISGSLIRRASGTLLFAVLATPQVGRAHVELDMPTATAGATYSARLRITHGCKGSPTTGVSVAMPEGVQGVRPMPKPGWVVDATTEKLPKPYEFHGRKITEEVTRVRWSGGRLASAHYDEFSILMRLPATAGKLYFKVIQTCEQGAIEWTQIPAPGRNVHDYPEPAAELDVAPAANRHSH